MELSSIGAQQASATEDTTDAIKQLLDYVTTYPNYGIIYCASNIVLAAHADDGFHNESKGCSRSGEHIYLSDNYPKLRCNGNVLTIAQIIKFVMTSAEEAELGAPFHHL